MRFAKQISRFPAFRCQIPILRAAQAPVRQQLVDSAIAAVGEKGAPWPNYGALTD